MAHLQALVRHRLMLTPMRLHYLILFLPALALADPAQRGGPREGTGFAEEADSALRPAFPPLPEHFHRGIAYAHSWRGGGYGTASSARTLAQLRELNVGWVALTPFGYQSAPDATEVRTIYDRPGHETDEAMAIDIQRAHALGMRVLLKPHIWIDHGSWPGEIAFSNAEDFERWMASYRRMILHYAEFAEITGTEALSMGCEFKLISGQHESQWRALIRDIRRRYSGQLTYSANWDEYERIPWWDAVDAVGVNAYFPLSESKAPTTEELLQGAAKVRAKLQRFHDRVGKPIIFTEIGYGSVEGAASRPWEAGRSDAVNVELQLQCYEAVIRTFSDAPWLHGVYWWKWFSAASASPRHFDHDPFSPRNKPAERLLEAWYVGEPSLAAGGG